VLHAAVLKWQDLSLSFRRSDDMDLDGMRRGKSDIYSQIDEVEDIGPPSKDEWDSHSQGTQRFALPRLTPKAMCWPPDAVTISPIRNGSASVRTDACAPTRGSRRPDIAHTTRLRAETARAPSRFLRASYVQHSIYF
jgi:hypothetical protein